MAEAGGFGNIFKVPELKRRILFTLGILVVYRIGAHIPTPGINSIALAELFARAQGTILGFFDMFSGGALSRLTIFALGIMPYISSSIILQLMTMVSPYLAQLKKEGEAGQKKITQYTRYGTIALSIVQASGIAVGLESMSSPTGNPIVPFPALSSFSTRTKRSEPTRRFLNSRPSRTPRPPASRAVTISARKSSRASAASKASASKRSSSS